MGMMRWKTPAPVFKPGAVLPRKNLSSHLNPWLKRSLLVLPLAALIYPMTQLEVFAQYAVNRDPRLAEECTNAVHRAQAKLAICTSKAALSSSRRDDDRDDDRDKRRGGIEPADCADQYARKLDKIRDQFLGDEGLDPELCGFEQQGPDGPGLIGTLVRRFFGDGPGKGSTVFGVSMMVSNAYDPLVQFHSDSGLWPVNVRAALNEPAATATATATASTVSTSDCYCEFPLVADSGWCMPPGSIDANGNFIGDICVPQILCEEPFINAWGEPEVGVLFTDANGQLWCQRGTHQGPGGDAACPHNGMLWSFSAPVCDFAPSECLSPLPALAGAPVSPDSPYGLVIRDPNFPYGPAATGDTMQAGETLLPTIFSSSGEYALLQQDLVLGLYRTTDGQLLWSAPGKTTIMQTDGDLVSYGFYNMKNNLVLDQYFDVVPTFASNTAGNPGSYLVVEDAGYVAIYSPDGTRLWRAPAYATGDTMQPGESLNPSIESANGLYTFIYQSDGNLVLYPNGSTNALWASGTNGTSQGHTIMQGDGNLVIYDANGVAVFATHTEGNPGSRLVVQNDGNVVIYAPDGTALWATNTVQ